MLSADCADFWIAQIWGEEGGGLGVWCLVFGVWGGDEWGEGEVFGVWGLGLGVWGGRRVVVGGWGIFLVVNYLNIFYFLGLCLRIIWIGLL